MAKRKEKPFENRKLIEAVDELLNLSPEAIEAAKKLIATETKIKERIKALTEATRPSIVSGNNGAISLDWLDGSRLDTEKIRKTMDSHWLDLHSTASLTLKIRRV